MFSFWVLAYVANSMLYSPNLLLNGLGRVHIHPRSLCKHSQKYLVHFILAFLHIQVFIKRFIDLCISVSKQEVERLLQLFKEFTKVATNEIKRGKGGVDRNRFRDILHQHFDMTDDVLMDKGNFLFVV